MAALEDAGFYCVDNMPVDLLPKFLELPIERDSEISGLALVMDLREKGFLDKYQSIFNELKQKGHNFEILFLEAKLPSSSKTPIFCHYFLADRFRL